MVRRLRGAVWTTERKDVTELRKETSVCVCVCVCVCVKGGGGSIELVRAVARLAAFQNLI